MNPGATNLPCGWYDEPISTNLPPVPPGTKSYLFQVMPPVVTPGKGSFKNIVYVTATNVLPNTTVSFYQSGDLKSWSLIGFVIASTNWATFSFGETSNPPVFFKASGWQLPFNNGVAKYGVTLRLCQGSFFWNQVEGK
jgi:hypothetical protein